MRKTGIPDIRLFPPFAKLPAQARRFLQNRLRKFSFSAGQTIVEINKRGQFFAILGNGVLGLAGIDGTESIRMPGDWFGEEMLISGAPSNYTAIARTDLTLWIITRREWLTAQELTPEKKKSLPRFNWGRVRLWLMVVIFMLASWWVLSSEIIHMTNQTITGFLLSSGRTDLAESYLRFAVRVQPDSPHVYDSLGYVLYLRGENTDALTAFLVAVQLDPELASAQNNLGVAWLNYSKTDLAIEHLKSAAELDPGNSEIYFNLGNAHLQGGDCGSAITAYRQAFELDPNLVEAGENWAFCLMNSGEPELARKVWTQILNLHPGDAQALQGLGLLDLGAGDGANALKNLEVARDADPLAAATYFYMGLAFEALDEPSRATAEFERALSLSQDPALKDLAAAHLEMLQK